MHLRAYTVVLNINRISKAINMWCCCPNLFKLTLSIIQGGKRSGDHDINNHLYFPTA